MTAPFMAYCAPTLVSDRYVARWPSQLKLAGLIVVVPVVVRVVFGGRVALTGRVGWHSTAGLAVVAAARLAFAQLDEGVGRRHPQLGREGGVVRAPVGKHGPRARSRPRFLAGLWHEANITADALLVPVRACRLARRQETRNWALG